VAKVSRNQLSQIAEMQEHARDAANLLKKMGNEYRLLVLCSLINGELSVGQLNDMMPLSQSALSQHLASLREAGLVNTKRIANNLLQSLW